MAYSDLFPVALQIADPQGDATIPKWRAPDDGGVTTIVAAHASVDTQLAAGTANYHSLRLLKYSMSGTVLTLAGTISALLGGTAAGGTAPGWTANASYPFTITDGELDSGDWVAVQHDETGTVAPLNISIVLEATRGPRTL